MVRKFGAAIGLFLIWTSSFGMDLIRPSRRRGKSAPKRLMQYYVSSRLRLCETVEENETVEEKKIFPVEETRLYKVVTAQHLDKDALLRLHRGSVWINKRDRNGCTPLQQGARLDIKNNNGANPYYYGLIYDEEQVDEVKKILPSRSKILNFIHLEMLVDKLSEL